MIKIEKSYELLLNTLSRLDEKKLTLTNEELSYEIFEELDSEYHTFLHEETVDRLIIGKKIPSNLRKRILDLRENIRPVMEGKHEIEAYRNDQDWQKLRNEANRIITEIKTATNKV